jgi:hypothetical protein
LPSVTCPASKIFVYISNKRHDFREKLLYKNAFFSYTYFPTLFHSKKNTARCYYQCTLVFKHMSYVENFSLFWKIFQNIQTSNFMGVEFFFANGRADITKLIVVFAILQILLKIGIEGSVLARISTLFQ